MLINLRQAALVPSIVPSSTRKINQSKALFDKWVECVCVWGGGGGHPAGRSVGCCCGPV